MQVVDAEVKTPCKRWMMLKSKVMQEVDDVEVKPPYSRRVMLRSKFHAVDE